MTSKTDYNKWIYDSKSLQTQLDEVKEENKFLRRELELCQETTMKQSQK